MSVFFKETFKTFLVVLLCSLPSVVFSSGFFELQLISRDNNNDNNSELQLFLNNYSSLEICLKEFQSSSLHSLLRSSAHAITPRDCTFGEKRVTFFSSDSSSSRASQQSIRIPFTFRWIGSFSFIIQLKRRAPNGLPLPTPAPTETHLLSDENSIPNVTQWKLRQFRDSVTGQLLIWRFRVTCDLYYHARDCATFCRSRDDTFGHYTCDEKSGRKVCSEGWKGENCDQPRCTIGCNEMHGFCESPDHCTCRNGWKGVHCDQCVEYPGCLHGYCVSPFQCICHRNWGGILCDQDLNYCATHEPCLNEGQCENIAPDHYRCICKRGFSGINCQTVVDSCATMPCAHGGTCLSRNNGSDFECACAGGFAGVRCERDLNECLSNPCANGGQCHDLHNDFRCTCPSGWSGSRCEEDVDECETLRPCIHFKQCLNTNGSYVCLCEAGFEGNQCETEVNDCQKNDVICQNGGFCIDLIDDFRCVCVNHFVGARCERIDESVCDQLGNHIWKYDDVLCAGAARVCLCADNHVIRCTCEESSRTSCGAGVMARPEMRLTFETHVTNSTCDTLYTLHALTSKTRDFCCDAFSEEKLVIVHSRDIPLFSHHVTRTLFPQLRHLSINNAQNVNSNSDSSTLEHVISVFFCVLFLFIICFVFVLIYFYFFKKRQTMNARENSANNEAVIHCIQNNLKESNSRAIDSNNELQNNKIKKSLFLTKKK